jgi:hypothetical protein
MYTRARARARTRTRAHTHTHTHTHSTINCTARDNMLANVQESGETSLIAAWRPIMPNVEQNKNCTVRRVAPTALPNTWHAFLTFAPVWGTYRLARTNHASLTPPSQQDNFVPPYRRVVSSRGTSHSPQNICFRNYSDSLCTLFKSFSHDQVPF